MTSSEWALRWVQTRIGLESTESDVRNLNERKPIIEFKSFVEEGVVEIQVHGKLQSVDFEKISPVVDEMIEHKGKIKGLVLNVTEFDGWDGIDALVKHFAFVKGHHRYIERVAAVGNKSWQRLLPKLASLFVKAEPRYFDIDEIEVAKQWARGESSR